MIPTLHIEENAAGLASLPADDPERVAAYDHARECPDCARLLGQAARMLAALDALPPAPVPPPPALRAVRQPILARLAALSLPTRLLSGVLVALWIVLVAMAKHRAGGAVAWIESATLAKRRSINPTPALAVATAAGALVGQAALHLTCPDRTAGLHVLAFHCGGVALAALLALGVGRRLARLATESH